MKIGYRAQKMAFERNRKKFQNLPPTLAIIAIVTYVVLLLFINSPF